MRKVSKTILIKQVLELRHMLSLYQDKIVPNLRAEIESLNIQLEDSRRSERAVAGDIEKL